MIFEHYEMLLSDDWPLIIEFNKLEVNALTSSKSSILKFLSWTAGLRKFFDKNSIFFNQPIISSFPKSRTSVVHQGLVEQTS